VFVLLGYFLGQEWQRSGMYQRMIILAVIGLVVLLAAVLMWRWRAKLHRRNR